MTTVSRAGDRITRIRFKLQGDKPLVEYHAILAELPDDAARKAWVALPKDIAIVDGWAEVTPR